VKDGGDAPIVAVGAAVARDRRAAGTREGPGCARGLRKLNHDQWLPPSIN